MAIDEKRDFVHDLTSNMATVAQLVRALDCDSRGRGFETRQSPTFYKPSAMTILQAFFLGIIQGLTEFLPVSSSGHLKIAESLFGFQNLHTYILFDLVCHLGTLLAISLVFWKDIKNTFTTDHKRLLQILIAIFPLFFLVPFLKPLKELFNQTEYLGFFFLLTATILWAGTKFKTPQSNSNLKKNRFRDAFYIGLVQLFAIFPGLSRSGSTISTAWLLGWNRKDALVFSFLIAIPAIIGGTCVEFLEILFNPVNPPTIGINFYLIGFLSAFITGYFTLLFLIELAIKERFQYFAWYCMIVGLWSIWYFNL